MAKVYYRGAGVEPAVISKGNFGAFLIYIVIMCAAFLALYKIGYYHGQGEIMSNPTQSIAPLPDEQIKYLWQEKERLEQTKRNVSYNLQRVRGLRDATSRALVDHYTAIESIAENRLAEIEKQLEQDAKLKGGTYGSR